MIRCLLLAPTPGADVENGDVQYCRDLLDSPPPGVEYVTYPEALASGEIRDMPSLRKGTGLPRGLRQLGWALVRSVVHGIRRSGMLLPDPVHWWEIVGEFDVVHSHCFPVRLTGRVPPVVVTDSAGTFWYWTAAQGRSERDVWKLLRRERRIAQRIGYIHPTVTPDSANRTLYFVAQGRGLAERLAIDGSCIQVAPAGVPDATAQAPLALDPPTLLFVARNFEVKGGPAALDVLRTVRREFPTCRLMVAGPTTPDPGIEGVAWLGAKSRAELYADVYPRADLFLYPTTFDCAPLVVVEAMAHGVPVVAPRAFGLPDLVQHGTTGLLVEPGDTGQLTRSVLALLGDPDRLRRMGSAAADDVRSRLSIAVRNEKLLAAYQVGRRPAARASAPPTS